MKTDAMYKDRPFRIAAAFAGALLATEFGGTTSIFKRLLSKWFYIEFAASLIIALIVVELVGYVTRRLDRSFDWKAKPVPRTCLQVLLGVMLPGVITFLLAAGYFQMYGMNILTDTWYVVYSLPFIMVMITLLNVYYLAHYFILKSSEKIGPTKKTLIITSGPKNIPVPLEKVAFFYRENGANFLKTFKGDAHLLSQSLDDLEELLDEFQFFRANRQMIVNRSACSYYQLSTYGKVELVTEPPFKMSIIISQKKAAHFKEWIEIGNVPSA